MGFEHVMKDIGHGLEETGKVAVEGAAAGAAIVATPPPAEVVEVERPLPGPYDFERTEEIVAPAPAAQVVVERPVIVEQPVVERPVVVEHPVTVVADLPPETAHLPVRPRG